MGGVRSLTENSVNFFFFESFPKQLNKLEFHKQTHWHLVLFRKGQDRTGKDRGLRDLRIWGFTDLRIYGFMDLGIYRFTDLRIYRFGELGI